MFTILFLYKATKAHVHKSSFKLVWQALGVKKQNFYDSIIVPLSGLI